MIEGAINSLPQAFGTLSNFGAFSTLDSKATNAMLSILQQAPRTISEQMSSDQKLNETLCAKRASSPSAR